MPQCVVDVWSYGVGSAFMKVVEKHVGRIFAFVKADSHMKQETDQHAFRALHRFSGHMKLVIVWNDATRQDAVIVITTSDNMTNPLLQL